MSEGPQMPKVDFSKDKIPEYIKDQVKVVEKDNRKRLAEFKRVLRSGRLSGFTWGSIAIGIYAYTMYAVKRETFLDNFDFPEDDD